MAPTLVTSCTPLPPAGARPGPGWPFAAACAPLCIFRIKVRHPGRPALAFTGLFASSFEAMLEAQADWPEATGISVMHIGRRAA